MKKKKKIGKENMILQDVELCVYNELILFSIENWIFNIWLLRSVSIDVVGASSFLYYYYLSTCLAFIWFTFRFLFSYFLSFFLFLSSHSSFCLPIFFFDLIFGVQYFLFLRYDYFILWNWSWIIAIRRKIHLIRCRKVKKEKTENRKQFWQTFFRIQFEVNSHKYTFFLFNIFSVGVSYSSFCFILKRNKEIDLQQNDRLLHQHIIVSLFFSFLLCFIHSLLSFSI